MNPRALTAVLVSAPLVLSGCFSSVPPKLEMAGAELGTTSAEAQVINFSVDATNPGPDPITIYDVEYAVTVEGREVFRATRAGEAVLGRYATRTLSLPVALPADAITAGQKEADLSATITYVPSGAFREVLFDAGLRPSTSLRSSANVTLPGRTTP